MARKQGTGLIKLPKLSKRVYSLSLLTVKLLNRLKWQEVLSLYPLRILEAEGKNKSYSESEMLFSEWF